MKIWKRVAAVSAATAVAVAMAGCSSSGSPGQGSTGKVTLRWEMSADSQAEVNVWKHLADMVHTKYPNITVKFESTPYASYYNKLTSQAAANNLACIAGLQAQRVSDVGNLFVDLKPYYSADKSFSLAAYEPSITKSLVQNGTQLAVPYDFGPYVMFYNRTAFKNAGLAEPKPGWTYAEFLADAKKLTTGGKYGFVADGAVDNWLPFVLSTGGTYSKGDKPDVANAGMVKGLTTVSDLVTKEKVAPQVPASGSSGFAADQWRSGNAAMYIDGPWQLINAKQNVKFDVGITTFPSIDGQSVATMSGTGFGITSSCNDKADAWKAISVIIGSDAQKYIAKSGRGLAALESAQPYYYKAAAVDGAQEAIDAELKTVNLYKTPPRWSQVSALMQQYVVEALDGNKSPASVLTQVQSQSSN
jgi:multiple sugar transport system substrate-binding protein